MAACERFGIPCHQNGDRFFIEDWDAVREVAVCPLDEVDAEIVIEDEAQLSDFEGGNLEVILREEILDPVPDDLSGFNW